jgi:hypothetical protein
MRRIRDLLDDLEWERRKGVLAALMPYSGEHGHGWSNQPPPPKAWTPLQVSIPRPRRPLPSERRLVEGARQAHASYRTNQGRAFVLRYGKEPRS